MVGYMEDTVLGNWASAVFKGMSGLPEGQFISGRQRVHFLETLDPAALAKPHS